MNAALEKNGGDIVASVLKAQGVEHLFTLCGGHISPILVSSRREGIRVVDCRDEAAAAFAADAVARMTGIPGVVAVTAGPGLTNTITAIENALLAQSPMVLIGGATATVLKGRGALQDIDQMALMRPAVKAAFAVKRVRHIGPMMEEAFRVAQEGVPGPVFVEIPVDLLYGETTIREWYAKETGGSKSLVGRVQSLYVQQHLFRVFRDKAKFRAAPPHPLDPMEPKRSDLEAAAELLSKAERPVLVVGSQTLARPLEAGAVAASIRRLGVPTWLGGTARGLLGRQDPVQRRHNRGKALKKADVVIVTGFPFDFRLGYGMKINPAAKIITVNRCKEDLSKNRRPTLGVHGDAGRFLQILSQLVEPGTSSRWSGWSDLLRADEDARDAEIVKMSAEPNEHVHPVDLALQIEERMEDDSVLVVDGGDFVATMAYVLRPRRPLSWLDPGVFGTLGVGGGFAVGAACVRPDAEVWLLFGDGASAYSIAELDTLARHGLRVIAVIGNDGSWQQIARDQVTLLGDDTGTVLRRNDYHVVAEGYGAKGLLLQRPADIPGVLEEAKRLSKAGHPVVINCWIGKTAFREGSISI
jgi:thiamine pyrophosphate-dependent acetolactate synthase large subunit-like protein